MRKNLINYLFYSFILFVIGVVNTYAYVPNVTNTNDLITATYTDSGRFYIGNSNSFNTAAQFNNADWGGYLNTSTNKQAMVSVKNGTYYIWHYGTNGQKSTAVKINVTNSCDNQVRQNQTGTFTLERCFVKTSSSVTMEQPLGTVNNLCASGYKPTGGNVVNDSCSNMSLSGLKKRYCKMVYQFTCVKSSEPSKPDDPEIPIAQAATLSQLSISNGTLSPAFKSSTKKYTASVAASVSSIKISATASNGNSLVSGFGSRTVKLAYGKNTVKVKVKNNAGAVTTYTITVTRADNRSGVNTLSNLTISPGTLTTAFSSDKTSYSVDVDNSVTSLTINATLTDNKSKFAAGFGPRTVSLNEGTNQIHIKVTSEKGVTKTYTITVNRGKVPDRCSLQNGELALLKGIEVQANDQMQVPIEGFDPLKKDYDGITVPYEIRSLTVLPLVQEEGDTYIVEGHEDLEEVNIPTEIKITVTSKACPSYSTIYTLNVTRMPESEVGGTADLKNITIKNHKDFKFEKNVLDYELTLNKGETELDIKLDKELDSTKCTILGNEELAYGSVITIECISQDEVDTATYTITIDGIEKGTNTFLVILLIIIIIIIIILLVMRMLGYKIYFNMEAVKAAFRGMGEKAKNSFDK